jgi:cell wall-associated NlpC family hydrolase
MPSAHTSSRTFTIATLLCAVIAALNPINSTLSRTAFLIILTLAGFALLSHLLPRFPGLAKFTLGTLLALALLIALWPGRPADPASLRTHYLSALTSFEGTRYIWGGEGHFGIDCSGLPRRALRTALVQEGLATANPALLRHALAHWWHDASARALAQGYRDYTIPLQVEGTLKKLDTTSLLPGDLAVTFDGIHLIVYLGDNRWIQADPSTERVITLNAQTDSNLWFNIGVTLHRWTLLTPPKE